MKKLHLHPGLAAFGALLSLSAAAHAAILLGNYPQINNNLSFSIGGQFQLAVSFTTPNQPYDVDSITLRLSDYTSALDTPAVGIYTDNADAPSTTLIGALFTNPNSPSTGINDFPFNANGSVPLSANTKYWMLVDASAGSFLWRASDSDNPNPRTPTGDATFGRFALSFDNGASYNDPNTAPYNFLHTFQINATAVPEPVHVSLAIGIALLAFAFYRRMMVAKRRET